MVVRQQGLARRRQSRMISGQIDLKSESASETGKIEHDVARKPRHTFRHHALEISGRRT
jgi:hypothetical protein